MSCVVVLLVSIDVVVVLLALVSIWGASTPTFISMGKATRKVTESVTT
jgi:hypothetical protein